MTTSRLKVFIGWDSREIEAYEVARHSLLKHASIPVDVIPLKQEELRAKGVYARPADPRASTEFTYTRFLTPYLSGYEGMSLFFDCDFMWRDDVAKLTACFEPGKAVSCVHHDYRPPEKTKMDGCKQEQYPRKNWSSLILFDCSHEYCKRLTPECVNTAEPAYLHRLAWVEDDAIGELSPKWNWLEGWYSTERGDPEPGAVHFTRGGPWFADWQDVDYADEWHRELDEVMRGKKSSAVS
ncbi:glycosyltransferase [Hyphococcus sp.]|uniref:glycosyltransferase n=1 Tax=Hyphococcus sp. TaxID=2038636 RepID=UPI0035C74F80